MRKNLLLPLTVVFSALMLYSCVKDVDFDQAQNITLTPVVELDLIYFNLDAGDFYDSISNTQRLTVRDTTEIRFLDDTGVRESLKRAEFLFNFTNSINREFQVEFQFLNEMNQETYYTSTIVAAGNLGNPVASQLIENVEDPEILELTMADRVVVTVTVATIDETVAGELNLQSKTTYYLEIKDRN